MTSSHGVNPSTPSGGKITSYATVNQGMNELISGLDEICHLADESGGNAHWHSVALGVPSANPLAALNVTGQ